MTTQQSLSQVWAETGGVTDPLPTKYSTGWIAEIPTFQNFNYVLQTTTKNILSLAEKGAFDHDPLVNYDVGAVARGTDGITYYALVANLGQDPVADTLHNFWKQAPTFGLDSDISDGYKGLHLKELEGGGSDMQWRANDATLTAFKPLIAFNTTSGNDNYLMGNISGHVCVVNTGAVDTPDDRNIAIGGTGVFKMFHEGNPPEQTDVPGTIPEAPLDGKLYARINGDWQEVTSTTVSDAPPPPVNGAGQGWYNLADGVHYLDIDDGDSSQWVPANAPFAYRSDLISEAPEDGKSYGRNNAGWVPVVEEAPADGKRYVRLDEGWVEDIGSAIDPTQDVDWTGDHTFAGTVELIKNPATSESQSLSFIDGTGTVWKQVVDLGAMWTSVDGVLMTTVTSTGQYVWRDGAAASAMELDDIALRVRGDSRKAIVDSGELVLGDDGPVTGESGIVLASSVSLKKSFLGTSGESLQIRSNSTAASNGKLVAQFNSDGDTTLHDGNELERLRVKDDGVDVTGSLTVNGLPVGGGGGVAPGDNVTWTGSHFFSGLGGPTDFANINFPPGGSGTGNINSDTDTLTLSKNGDVKLVVTNSGIKVQDNIDLYNGSIISCTSANDITFTTDHVNSADVVINSDGLNVVGGTLSVDGTPVGGIAPPVAAGHGTGATMTSLVGLDSFVRTSLGVFTATVSGIPWFNNATSRKGVLAQVCQVDAGLTCGIVVTAHNTITFTFHNAAGTLVDPVQWNWKVEVYAP